MKNQQLGFDQCHYKLMHRYVVEVFEAESPVLLCLMSS